jgi:hypothetical protein
VHDNGAIAQSCVVQKFCTTGGQRLLSLPGTMKKNFSFHFKRYNLTIREVKCHENSFGLLELEMADLERFLRKTPLVL